MRFSLRSSSPIRTATDETSTLKSEPETGTPIRRARAIGFGHMTFSEDRARQFHRHTCRHGLLLFADRVPVHPDTCSQCAFCPPPLKTGRDLTLIAEYSRRAGQIGVKRQ